MSTQEKRETASRILLESRLPYHHRCLREDATDPTLSPLERLALVRERTRRVREIRGTLRARLAAGRKLP
jgi:hypothetical protein